MNVKFWAVVMVPLQLMKTFLFYSSIRTVTLEWGQELA